MKWTEVILAALKQSKLISPTSTIAHNTLKKGNQATSLDWGPKTLTSNKTEALVGGKAGTEVALYSKGNTSKQDNTVTPVQGARYYFSHTNFFKDKYSCNCSLSQGDLLPQQTSCRSPEMLWHWSQHSCTSPISAANQNTTLLFFSKSTPKMLPCSHTTTAIAMLIPV